MARADLISPLCALFIAISGSQCQAQIRPLLQYQHTAWTLQQGAPSQIKRMAQTKDGYIWLATAAGLVRFDGVSFDTYQLPHGENFPHSAIQSLAADGEGGLWIGYALGDTSYLKDGVLTTQRFQDHVKRGGGGVNYMVVRRDGSTWAATDYGLLRLVAGQWKDAEEVKGLGIKSSYCLFEDSHRTLWMATELLVYRLPYGAEKFEKTLLHPGANGHFAETPDGTVWIADQYGVHDVEDPLATKAHLPFIDVPLDLSVDDTGAIWFSGYKTGVTRIADPSGSAKLPPAAQRKAIENFSVRNGLTSELAYKSLIDREGNLWFATSDGLDKFRRTDLTPAPLPASFGRYWIATDVDGALLIGTWNDGLQRLKAGQLSKVPTGIKAGSIHPYRAPDGKIWLASTKLGYLEGGRYTDVSIPAEMAAQRARVTQALTVGTGGDLWLQQDSQIGLFRLRRGEWSAVPDTTGKPPAVVMATDPTDHVWAGYTSGLIKIFDGSTLTTLDPTRGLTVGGISALYPSAEGMWIGGQNGLNAMRGDHPVEIAFAGDLKIQGISGITRTEDGALWLNTLSGVLRIPSDEVDRALKTPGYTVHYRLFTYMDGLSGKPPQIRSLPTIVRGSDGTVWFATSNGVVSVDSSHIHTNTLVPPVSIKDFVIDGNKLDTTGPLTLPKGSTDLQVNYTALSFSIPERVQFRYKLDGYDKQWQNAGTRRQAFYTHLPPGHYTFRVVACNNDGVWNDVGASLPFTLPPTFIQSWYFKLILFALAFTALWFLVRLRAWQETERLQARLAERFNERQRIARDLHDTLLQDLQALILKFSVATSKLPQREPVRPVFEDILNQSDSVLSEGRSLITNLHVFGDPATVMRSALKSFGDELHRLHPRTSFVFEENGKARELTTDVSRELSFLIREALTNAFRHADATHVWVTLTHSEDGLALQIRDDGCGINESILTNGFRPDHWGLRNMKERAERLGGHYVLRSSTETGTTVDVALSDTVAYVEPSQTLLGKLRHFFTPHGLPH